jgi:L-amino acid N-acyltransferase YncA
MHIRACQPDDIPQICEIYNHFIRHTTVTFEETPLEVPQMQARIDACVKLYPWLVCVGNEGTVAGYAYAARWKERAAYRRTAESTVYVRDGQSRKGVGGALYESLLASLAAQGCHVVLGCIAIPNDASVALHERFGFQKVAHFSEVGFKHGRWLDVGYWQKRLEGGASA